MGFPRAVFTGFTERRRRELGKKPDVLRLETRNTITEPISITGLSITGAQRSRPAWDHAP